MPTSSEKRALLFLASLAALGLCVRGFRGGSRGGARGGEGGVALERQIAAVDSAAARGKSRTSDRDGRTRPSARPRRPRGDSLERADLGDGPPARVSRPAPGGFDPLALNDQRRREVAAGNQASQKRLDEMTRVITVTPKAPITSPARAPATRSPVDLDTADEAAIATVPWIGPTLAARIVRERTTRGSFGSLDGLQRVAGIGPGLAARIASHVRFSGSGLGPTKFIRLRKMRP